MTRKCSSAPVMTSINHDESIEIISVHSEDPQRCLHEPLDQSTYFTDYTPTNGIPEDTVQVLALSPSVVAPVKKEIKTKKQKLIGRVVAIVAVLMLVMSILLVGVTLSMTDHIDEMVREMNWDYISRPTRPSQNDTLTSSPLTANATSTRGNTTTMTMPTEPSDDYTTPPIPQELVHEKG